MRRVILRTSFVLGRDGGALLAHEAGPVGPRGKVGHGRQGISWIHEEDMNRLFARAIADDEMNAAIWPPRKIQFPIPCSCANCEGLWEFPSGAGGDLDGAARGAADAAHRSGAGSLWPLLRLASLRDEGFEFAFPDLGPALRICTNPPDAASRLVVSYPASKGDGIMPTTIRFTACCVRRPRGSIGRPGCRRHGEVAAAERIHRQGPPPDARVGGTHKMSFTNFTRDRALLRRKYLELVPNERIRYTDKFDDAQPAGEMQVTITLRKVSVGTE